MLGAIALSDYLQNLRRLPLSSLGKGLLKEIVLIEKSFNYFLLFNK